MEKKWWILIILVIGIVAVFIAIGQVSKPKIQRIQGGVVITTPGDMFPGQAGSESAGSEDFDGGDADPSGEFSDDLDPVPLPEEHECWQCPLDGTIISLDDLGISFEDLTDAMISNVTNCTNKTQLVPVDCPVECNDLMDNDGDLLFDYPSDPGCASETDDSEDDCGNGVCEDEESVDSCPGDCVVAPAADGGDDTDSEDDKLNEDKEDSGKEDSGNGIDSSEFGKPDVPTYYRYTYDKKQCVLVVGEGLDECRPGDKDFVAQSPITGKGTTNYPRGMSFLERLFAKMFGFQSS
ncbi:MAG: hypothetical protein ABH864_04435 [archaeon]